MIASGSLSREPQQQLHRFAPRAVLPPQLDRLWQIESGFVRTLTWLGDGTNVALGIWSEGDVVGVPFSKADPFQMECLTKVEAIALPFSQLQNASKVLLSQLHQAEALMQIHSQKRVDIKVLKFLDWLDQRFGQDVATGRLLNLRLTHQDISETIGTTRVTVTRTLNQLEKQGLIQCLPLQRIVVQEHELWHYQI